MIYNIVLLIKLPSFTFGLFSLTPYHYWNRAICLVPQALGKGPETLGEHFAECQTSDTRQSVCLVSRTPLGKSFPLTVEIVTDVLPSVGGLTLGKVCKVCLVSGVRH